MRLIYTTQGRDDVAVEMQPEEKLLVAAIKLAIRDATKHRDEHASQCSRDKHSGDCHISDGMGSHRYNHVR